MGTVVFGLCFGVLTFIWGLAHAFWGYPSMARLSIFVSIVSVCSMVYYYFRVARHLRSGSPRRDPSRGADTTDEGP